MFPSRPSGVNAPTLSNTPKLSDSRRRCRLCSGTTPFSLRLSRASCCGSCRSDLSLSACALGPRTAVVYASSGAAATLGNGACLRRAGRLRPRHRQPGVPPEGPAHRSPQPGRGRSVRRAGAAAAAAAAAAEANSPGKPPLLRPFLHI